jgi:hypothetical protein
MSGEAEYVSGSALPLSGCHELVILPAYLDRGGSAGGQLELEQHFLGDLVERAPLVQERRNERMPSITPGISRT